MRPIVIQTQKKSCIAEFISCTVCGTIIEKRLNYF